MASNSTLPLLVFVSSSAKFASESVRCATARYITALMAYRIINPSSINGTAMQLTSAHPMYSNSTICWSLPTPWSANSASTDTGINNAVVLMPTTRIVFGTAGFIRTV